MCEGENKESISEHHMTKSVTSVRKRFNFRSRWTCCWLTPSWTALRPWKIDQGPGGWGDGHGLTKQPRSTRLTHYVTTTCDILSFQRIATSHLLDHLLYFFSKHNNKLGQTHHRHIRQLRLQVIRPVASIACKSRQDGKPLWVQNRTLQNGGLIWVNRCQ